MEVIQSFTIDHTCLKPGIYVSRVDRNFTTFDLRITEPNKEPAVAPAAIHSIEHLMATWFRNSRVKDDVVYVGPMGCLTGMYIIMTGTYSVYDMRELTIECLEWILTQTEVPATTPDTCGNYLLHDLPMCKWECARYLDRLKNDFHCEYNKLKVTLEDGKSFPKGEALYGTFDDSEGRVALYGGRLVDKGTCKGAYFHGIGMANVIWAETQDTKADR